MTEVTAQLGRQFGPTDGRSLALGSELNLKDGAFDANLFREPEYFIYLYTVSEREFLISQPPLFPRLWVPAKKAGERASLVCRIPHPFQQIDREGAVGDLITRGHRAELVAQSLCNPNNLTLDQDAVPPEKSVLGLGVDLNAQGVFWSRNNPPTDEEINKAIKRRERYYQLLLERARTLEISNPKELEMALNQDYHQAAEYFHLETSWHKKLVRQEECPLCGGSMKPGVAIHLKSLGGCGAVVDWDRAIASGLAKESDRPKVSSRAAE